ncbi:MAG: SDR family oxidoreductase [Lachnospiraceae bacterium]|jgi:NAD(P)-dependent dehydrogenase (short-subunit alcohol dehydrogenase family)|nr:SDR family oxidoreductase [Lachnospiraceae bacterium]MCI8960657.1 SDR family oxidoreductase [Lachnospiraceae bacterium]
MSDYQKLFSLKGRRALVTGGTGGLGSAIAAALLEAGADTAVCGGHPEKAAGLKDLAGSLGRRFLSLRCDITNPQDVSAMMDAVREGFGGLDILVNSAGINRLILAEDYDDETFAQVMDLNLNGLHTVTREAGKRFFIPQGYGRILNLSSVKSLIGTTENYIAYCASKGAVNMYTRQLACEWGKYHITVNAIAPTFVRTPINSFQLDDPVFYKKLTDRIPLGRIGQEQDIACAALYLCSDAAAFVNGQVLAVDGGLTAMQ